MLSTNILYIMATGSLLVGSALDFDTDELASYFFLIGSSLFFVKASMNMCAYYIDCKQKKVLDIYDGIL